MRDNWIRLSLILWSLFWSSFSLAERLPVKQYTVADGLAQGSVWRIHQDARGFLWLATSDGLSRFDGYRFTNYGMKDGLGDSHLSDVVSDRRGRLWSATGEGVSLLLEETEAVQQRKKFKNFLLATGSGAGRINNVLRILFDAENRLWCVTDVGLYRARSAEVVAEQFERIVEFDAVHTPPQVLLDRRGRGWVSMNEKLLRIEDNLVTADELWREAGETGGNADHRWVKGLVELADGRLLMATNKDLYEFIEPVATNQRGSWRRLSLPLASQNIVGTIHPAADGGLWIGTDGGLIRYRDGQQVNYRIGNSPNPFTMLSFLSDRDGNLWIGTRQTGLLKLKGEAVLVYDASDGLVPVMDVYWLHETHDGRMTLFGRPVSPLASDETFLTNDNAKSKGALTHLQPPPSFYVYDVLQDSRKNWWVLRWLPDRKIYKLRFIPGPDINFSVGYELTAADGWVDGSYSTLYEDLEGYMWLRNPDNQIFRIEYTNSGRPRVVEIVKKGITENAVYFLRDPSGAIWWSNGGTVWRQQKGKIDTIPLPLEKPRPRNFFVDRKGRLWISTINHGVLMTETPNGEQPRFVNYTTANGLAHNQVEDVCQDDDGTMWFGTMRGLCRLDEQTGRLSLFSLGENSLSPVVRDLHKEARGYLWVSVLGAVIRINPRLLPRPALQAPVYFNRVSIAGEPLALGETGGINHAPLELAAGRNNLEIEYFSPNFRDENTVQYQYKLEGIDSDWSTPGLQREVNYANLAPGRYRFWVRAVADASSATPASLRFTILRPLWQRWWFLSLLALTLGGLMFAAYRYRVAQVVQMERLRLRIAHDLHDDIGANLTRISILSEVAKQQNNNGAPPPGELLDSIADISRESVAAMNDIVWAISPEHDSLPDLTSRMRRHAEEVFMTRDIRLDFQTLGQAGQLKLTVNTRRDLYLVFKEAVNNAARHAACTTVSIQVCVSPAHIQLTVRDDGSGFVRQP